ncbi:hypothetical protein PFISCL1PPCAC_16851, partial [Pristionchus fissidentatus]
TSVGWLVEEHCIHGNDVRCRISDQILDHIDDQRVGDIVDEHRIILPVLYLGHLTDISRSRGVGNRCVSHYG